VPARPAPPGVRAVAVDLAVGGSLIAYHAVAHGRGARHHRVAANLGAAGVAVAVARAVGITYDELGLARRSMSRGLRTGGRGAALVAAAVGAAAAWPRTRATLASTPTEPATDLAFDVLVRIPLETALAEEVLFRGVSYALARHHGSHRYATAVTAVTFGLWHVGPAQTRSARHRDPSAAPTTVPHGVAVDVAVTALTNVALVELRRRSGSVLAPIVVHATVNAVLLMAPVVLGRLRG
jgi:membrane protease YdiL (CAAX protease family)